MRLPIALLSLAALQPCFAAEAISPDVVQVAAANQYFSVMPGYFGADKGRVGSNSKEGLSITGIYGYRWSPHWGLELNLTGSTIETGSNQGTDFYQQGGTADLVYGFKDRSESWTPFVLVGVGGVYNDVIPDSQDAASFIVNAGLGAVTGPLTSLGFKLRGEGRIQRDQFQDGYTDYRLMAGIEIPFGTRTVTLQAVAPPVVEIREVIKEVEVVRAFVDSDKDTIEDSRDKCPDTPQDLKVDADGCVIEGQAIALRGVTFAFNKAVLQLNAQTVLDYVVKGMKGQPSMKVEIEGHTDSIGSVLVNLKLSQQRAEAVRTYLIAQGIETARLTAKGYGKSELLVKPETNDIDRERNRRVMFRVISK